MSWHHHVLISPLITEKNTVLKEKNNTYVFEVHPDATKGQIKKAVSELFKVKVCAIRTAVVKGKFKRMGRYGGYRPNRKKAFVCLEKGQTISQFGES